MRNVPCNVEIKTPHYDHTTRAHRHTVPGHLPPPVRLGLGGQRRQGILFLPSGARGGSCANLCGRSTSYPTALLPAAAGVRSTAPPAGKEGPGSGHNKGSGHILQGAHLATVPQSYIRTTA
eukprot:scaffold5206_cov154-Isochrysis_galbana.AAC.5